MDCVRLAVARADRGLRARRDRLGHQPRRQPGRRHHLLRAPSRRRWRASCSASRASPSRSSPRGARWTSGSGTCSTSTNAAAFTARVVDRLDDVPLPAGTLLNINVPRGRHRRCRGRAAGQAHLPGPARPDRGGRRRPPAVPRLRRLARPRRRARHRPRRGLRRPHRRHAAALRPHRRARHGGLARVRPRPAAGGSDDVRRSARPSCASSSPTTATATTSSTTRRSATTPTTRCWTSCARSSASIRSC